MLFIEKFIFLSNIFFANNYIMLSYTFIFITSKNQKNSVEQLIKTQFKTLI